MSSYLRSIPNKFTSFVNTRKQVTNIDHQLPKYIKSSLFLEEFLGTQTTANSTINLKERLWNSVVGLSSQNIPVIFFNASIERPKTFSKKYNLTTYQMMKLQKQINIQTLTVINSDLTNKNLIRNSTQWERSLTNLKTKEFNLSHIEMASAKRIFNKHLPNLKRESNLCTEISSNVQNVNKMQTSEDRKPSETRLQNVYDVLHKELPLLFVATMDYSIYTNDLIFVNNIKGTTTAGIYSYVKQIGLLKIIGHLRFAYIKLHILKMTMHPEDNSIRVRWRIVGISGTRIFLTFWKFKIWNINDELNNESAWYDGFSTFFVNNDGKIFKHIVDKMMPNQDIEEKMKTPIETKLALFTVLLGLDSHYFMKFCLKKYPQLFRIK